MIKINLLPPEFQGKKATKKVSGPAGPMLGNLLVILVAAAMTALVASSAYYAWSRISEANDTLANARRDLTKQTAEKDKLYKKYKDMKDKWDRMKDQKEILDVLMPDDRIMWSMKLNMLSDLIPQGVYVTQLALTEKTDQKETKSSIARREAWKKSQEQQRGRAAGAEGGAATGAAAGASARPAFAARRGASASATSPEPAVVKKPIITQTLTIDAIATGSNRDERFDKMLEFERALGSYETKDQQGKPRKFLDSFEPDVNFGPMEVSTVDNTEVWAFQIILKTKAFGADPAPKEKE